MKAHYLKQFSWLLFWLLFISSLLYLLSTINPEELVHSIGIQNGYIVAIVVSFFSGFSVVTVATAYGAITALLAAGLDPLLMGLASGLGMVLGDSAVFYLGVHGRKMVTGELNERAMRVSRFLLNHKLKRYVPVFAYIYIAFTPMPNDWLLLVLAALKYPPRKIYPIIILGDLTLMCIFIFLVTHGISMLW